MTESQPAFDQARSVLQQVMNILNVARVICVDDLYSDKPEDALISAYFLDHEVLLDIFPELKGASLYDEDVLKKQINDVWERLEHTTRKERSEKILKAARREAPEQEDYTDATILSELISPEKLITLSPTQWAKRSTELLKENDTCRTLFLFDQDLSADGGDSQGGIKIIASLLGQSNNKLICGLLTHTVTPENQFDKWVELSKTYSIPRDRFLVIPKQHLNKDPILISQLLKLLALTPDFSSLKDKIKSIITEAVDLATEQVNDINIYDLDHIVFRVSEKEGLWEPDMLFRLFSLFHRREALNRAHMGGELEEIASRLRSVSLIPTETTVRLESSTWKIQKQELYESEDNLNKHYLPLELGDIFKKAEATSNKFYILLAQPCDLMVRSNGKRQPELLHLPLAEIISSTSQPKPNYADEMPYFGEDPSDLWFVNMRRVHHVKAIMLDLCIFNSNGEAIMRFEDNPPTGIRPAWKARHEILKKEFNRSVSRIDKILSPIRNNRNITDMLRPSISEEVLKEGFFKGELVSAEGKQCLKYNCQRIGRLSRERAFGMLMTYTSCLSRPAFDRDFGVHFTND